MRARRAVVQIGGPHRAKETSVYGSSFHRLTAVGALTLAVLGAPVSTPTFPGTAVASNQRGDLAAMPRQYRVVDFGFDGEARGINDRGDVVGEGRLTPFAFHPFLWRNGRVTDLGVLERGEREYGRATDINDRGQVVGFSVVNQDPEQSGGHAFLWQNGTLTDLDPYGVDSAATAINNRGQIIGTRYTTEGRRAFLWQNGVMTDLGAGNPQDINDRGQVIGQNLSGGSGATMWYRGRVQDLGTPPGLEDWRPVAINERGWIVGTGTTVDLNNRACLWRAGSFVDLGTFGGPSSNAIDINDRGEVLVTEAATGEGRGFVWRNGSVVDLFERGISEYSTLNALGDRGQILGSVFGPDTYHAVLYR
jgi:probable HAF family extracellular repeat protein